MSTNPHGEPSPWSDPAGPDPAGEPAEPRPPEGEAPGEPVPIPLPPEPSYEVVEVAEVGGSFCWWCGDPGPVNRDSLCHPCEVRKAERDRERGRDEESRRARQREREEYDYEDDPGDEEEEYEEGWGSGRSRSDRRRDRDDELDWWGPLQGALVFFAVLMIVSLAYGASLLSKQGGLTEEDILHGTATIEVLDTIIVLIALAVVSRKALPRRSIETRSVAWGVALPVFGLLIGLNLLYTALLRQLLDGGDDPAGIRLTTLTLILICVQPALIEELFFRYVAFGAFYRAAGLHATVWITGMMFAVSHIYNPLGVPYLFLVGVVLGYLRVWGGLALPMVVHFFHNLAVLAITSP
jgi:membrane protease YdiL (CAAX protease family)